MKPFNVFPYDSKFDFMRLRWVSLGLALALLVVSIGAMAFKGFNFALDFTGGTVTELRFERPVDIDDVRTRLDRAGFAGGGEEGGGLGGDAGERVGLVAMALEIGGRNLAEHAGEATGRVAIFRQIRGAQQVLAEGLGIAHLPVKMAQASVGSTLRRLLTQEFQSTPVPVWALMLPERQRLPRIGC